MEGGWTVERVEGLVFCCADFLLLENDLRAALDRVPARQRSSSVGVVAVSEYMLS